MQKSLVFSARATRCLLHGTPSAATATAGRLGDLSPERAWRSPPARARSRARRDSKRAAGARARRRGGITPSPLPTELLRVPSNFPLLAPHKAGSTFEG